MLLFADLTKQLPVLLRVGGLVAQSTVTSECISSEIALHKDAAVVSCWDKPCRLAALMNLIQTHLY